MFVLDCAQAAPWNFSTSGVISFGSDADGTFFPTMNYELAGEAFTLVTMIDPNLLLKQDGDFSQTYGNDYNFVNGWDVPFIVTLTLNGKTKTFAASSGTSAVVNLVSVNTQNGPGTLADAATQYVSGYTVDGISIYALQSLVSLPNATGIGVSLNQNWTYIPQQNDYQLTQFQSASPDGFVWFVSQGGAYQPGNESGLTSISISTVPLPGTHILMLIALLFIGLMRRSYPLRARAQ